MKNKANNTRHLFWRALQTKMAILFGLLIIWDTSLPCLAKVKVFDNSERLIVCWYGNDDARRQVVFDRGKNGQGLPVELSYKSQVAEINVASNLVDISRYFSWEASDVSYQGRFLEWNYTTSADGKSVVVQSTSEMLIPPEGIVYDDRIKPLFTFKVTRWYTVFEGDDGFYFHQRIEPGGSLKPLRWRSITRLSHLKTPVKGLQVSPGCNEWFESQSMLSGTQVILLKPQDYGPGDYQKASHGLYVEPGQNDGGFFTYDVLHTPQRNMVLKNPFRYTGVHFVAGPDDLSKPNQTRGQRYYSALTANDIKIKKGSGVKRAEASRGVVIIDASSLPCTFTIQSDSPNPRTCLVWVRGLPQKPKGFHVLRQGRAKRLLDKDLWDVWTDDLHKGQTIFFVNLQENLFLQLE